MAENEKILDIKVRYEDAIRGITEYQKKIDELTVAEMKLKAEKKSGKVSQEEYDKSMEASKAVATQYRDAMRVLRKEMQNNLRQEKENEGSLKQLRAELSNLTKQYDELSRAERNGAKGKELQEKLNEVTMELKVAEEETQRFYRNVGNYQGAIKPMRQELKELTLQLAQMEREGLRGSEAYDELAKKAGALKDNIADANAEVKRYASDTRLLDDVTNIVTTGSLAWQTYQGAAQAFGVESEEAMEAMSRLQGIMAVTNGLQQLNARFTDNSTAAYKIYHKILQMVGLEEKAVAVSKQAMTTATVAETTAETANAGASTGVAQAKVAETAAVNASTVAMTGASVAAKVLRVALMTLGIGLVVTALGALVAYWDDVVDFFSGVTEESKKAAEAEKVLAETTAEAKKAYAKAGAEIQSYMSRIDSFTGSKKQEAKLVKELNDKYGAQMGYYNSLSKWKQVLTEKGKAYCDMLLKEAEAQAFLSKYTEAYLNLLEVRRKAEAGEYDHWYNTAYGDKASRQKAINEAEADMNRWLSKYKETMKEAESLQVNNDIGGFTNKTSTSNSKSGSSAGEIAKKEQEELRKAEDLLTQITLQGAEERRKALEVSYNRQIEDLKKRLQTERDLTTKAREAVNAQIVALETLKEKKLAELDSKAVMEEVSRAQKRIEMKLATVKKESDEYYQLQLTRLANEQALAEESARQEEVSEEEKQQNLLLIRQKYGALTDKLLEEQTNERIRKQQEAIKSEYETKILETELGNGADGENPEIEKLRLEMEEKQALLESAQQLEGETEEAFYQRKLEMQQAYNESKKALADKEVEIEQIKLRTIAELLNGVSSIMEAFGEENTALAKFSKVLALGEIAVNTGKAIAAGVAQAQTVPFPGNIAAIATTVATVMANIATAIKTVKSAKFAEGGLVTGEGTATSDSIPARLSNGESVLTAAATQMFAPALSAFNQLGGGVPIVSTSNSQTEIGEDMLARAVAKGMQESPRPVVSVEEIRRVSDRVDVVENLGVV